MWRVRPWRNLREQSGFTLIELLGVALILIVLMLMALPVYADVTDTARKGRSEGDLYTLSQAIERHYTDHGKFPGSLNALINAGYLKRTEFATAWSGESYYYALTEVTVGETRHLTYIVGVPRSQVECERDGKACDPSGPVPTVPYDEPTLQRKLRHMRLGR